MRAGAGTCDTCRGARWPVANMPWQRSPTELSCGVRVCCPQKRDYPYNLEPLLFGRELRAPRGPARELVTIKEAMRQLLSAVAACHRNGKAAGVCMSCSYMSWTVLLCSMSHRGSCSRQWPPATATVRQRVRVCDALGQGGRGN